MFMTARITGQFVLSTVVATNDGALLGKTKCSGWSDLIGNDVSR
jgi:hypothetical protein